MQKGGPGERGAAADGGGVELTDHGLHDALGHLDELLVDLDGEVAQHLPVLGQVKVLQAVLVLLARVLGHERLGGGGGRRRQRELSLNKTFRLDSLASIAIGK